MRRKIPGMYWFAFLGGFSVVALGFIADYVTGSWSILAWGIAGLLAALCLIAGNKKPPPGVHHTRRRKLK
jgi:hypothetical protein